ncbi:hypothetical protein IFM89_034031 [Coptis chinensis]|uniref:X8 domain-containing protein n=1 Tax=Coptis chinensis TaxID=261450 RepID=A0A835MGF2_9MAGN|nr:hypothetical protein IFM89_034031 [Coptis chinensis]
MAYASSLDVIGCFSSVADTAILLEAISGHDIFDATSSKRALDYACGAGADCNPVLQSGSCFQPNTVRAHCSYAVNSYFQRKGQGPGTCDFSGAATVTATDPSSGTCTFPSSAGSAGTTPSTGTAPGTGTGTGTTPPGTGTGTELGLGGLEQELELGQEEHVFLHQLELLEEGWVDLEVLNLASQLVPTESLESKPLKGLRVGVIRETLVDGVDVGVASTI